MADIDLDQDDVEIAKSDFQQENSPAATPWSQSPFEEQQQQQKEKDIEKPSIWDKLRRNKDNSKKDW